jgi:oligoendopeptidase F
MNTLAFEKQVEDRWRKYPTPAASRHIANEVDADAVEAMEAAVVTEAYPQVSHRYYALKAKLMGRKTLDYWDRNAPLDTAKPRAYDWKQAQGMVLESFSDLAPKFADTAKTFFDQPWIDARPRAGKQSGAFSHPVTADRHPYVFMNYMGERRDVLTLAHELGHAVHQTLCQPLGTLLADTPLTLAETASIFGEGLVFERLLAGATKAERLGLLAGQIEDGINTVIRQIAFHRFETRFHAARFEGELSAEQIGAIWLETMGESLGPGHQAQRGLRALLGLCQPLRPRAVLRLRLRLWRPAGAWPDGEAPRGPGGLRAPVRGPASGRGHADLCRGPAPLRPQPPGESLLDRRHDPDGAAGGRLRGTGLIERRRCAFLPA